MTKPTPEEIETAKKVIELLPKHSFICECLKVLFPNDNIRYLIRNRLTFFWYEVGKEIKHKGFYSPRIRCELPHSVSWFSFEETGIESATYRIRRLKEVYNL